MYVTNFKVGGRKLDQYLVVLIFLCVFACFGIEKFEDEKVTLGLRNA